MPGEIAVVSTNGCGGRSRSWSRSWCSSCCRRSQSSSPHSFASTSAVRCCSVSCGSGVMADPSRCSSSGRCGTRGRAASRVEHDAERLTKLGRVAARDQPRRAAELRQRVARRPRTRRPAPTADQVLGPFRRCRVPALRGPPRDHRPRPGRRPQRDPVERTTGARRAVRRHPIARARRQDPVADGSARALRAVRERAAGHADDDDRTADRSHGPPRPHESVP